MKKEYTVAIVGATGAVGQELLKVLDQRAFPIKKLILFASSNSIGKIIKYKGQEIACSALTSSCFDGVDIAFFDASDEVSKEWAPHAAASGAWVVDNSATYRMEKDIPLVVPEINGQIVLDKLKNPALTSRERIIILVKWLLIE